MTLSDAPVIRHYRLLRLLGEGGMGMVYEAEQLEPVRRRVAVKVLRAGMDTAAFIGRFEAERQALALMDHPNIARVFDAGQTAGGLPYCAMEFVAGVMLTQFCDDQRLTTRSRLELMIEVCDAVHHAHQKGIIHRDLKPSNVLVALKGDRPVPMVIDFGIAKALTGRLADRTFITDLGQPIGTPAYMSPEQWEAGQLDLDTRTDIYSLGVMLYELLVGQLPYDWQALARAGPAAPAVLRESTPSAPSTRIDTLGNQALLLAKWRSTDPSGLARELRGDLDWITLKALEPERARRYETVHGLALDLGRHLRSEPVLARPPSATYRFSRFVRRHRLGTAVVAVALVLGLGFTAVTVVQARRITRERDAATVAAARADALNEFLQQTLLSPDPVDGLGRDATMLEALDVAAGHLRDRALPQSEADAAMKSVIGWAYFKLGSYDRAKPLLLEALAMRRRLPGADSLDLAESAIRAAAVYDILAQPDSAAPLYHQALALRRRAAAPTDRRLAEALVRAGAFFYGREDTSASREALMEAFEIYRQRDDSAGLATVETHLGMLEYHKGNLGQAEQRFGSALRYRRSHLGDHPSVAEALVNYGAVLEDLGRIDSAEAAYREGLRIHEQTLGPEHDELTATLNNLALLIGQQGRLAEAQELFRKAIATDQKQLGPAHPAVGIDLLNLANVSCKAGDGATGEPAARRAMEIFSRGGSPSGWELAQVRVTLGVCLTRLRRFPEAERHILAGRDGLVSALGKASWRVDSAEVRLRQLYGAWKGGAERP